MLRLPHRLIEGCLITAHAIESRERLHLHPRRVPDRVRGPAARARARRATAGLLGGVDDRPPPRRGRVHLRRGDGAARVARGQARAAALEAAVPRVSGLYGSPTLINNVETIATVPLIIEHRRGRVREDRAARLDRGRAVFSLSGNVRTAGQLRARARHDAARADLRPRRRDRRRPRAEGDHPGRLVGAGADRRPDRHAAGLRLDGRGGHDVRLRRGDRRSTTAPAWCSWRCGSRSSTCTSRAGSARRAARGRAGWCSSCRRSRTARASSPSSTCCSTSATASSASACARSATRPRCRSRATSTSSATSSRRTSTQGGCPFGGESSLEGVFAPVDQHTHSPVARGAGVSAGPSWSPSPIDGREVQVPKGIGLVETALAAGIEIPVFCYEPRLGPADRRLPHVPRRDRGDAEAPGRLHA